MIARADLADVLRMNYPFADTIFTPDQSESGNGRTGTGIDPNSATEFIRFHTDFTQIDRPGPHSARRLANPTTHQCP